MKFLFLMAVASGCIFGLLRMRKLPKPNRSRPDDFTGSTIDVTPTSVEYHDKKGD